MEAPPNGRHAPVASEETALGEPDTHPRPIAFSPPQLAVGAAVIAALILIGFRRLRRRGR
jgi:hypothetical protein